MPPKAALRPTARDDEVREQSVVEGQQSEREERNSDRGATARLCAISRAERPIVDLIRFVAGPDGDIVADLGRKLPGRGVWLTADRSSVDAAVNGKVFSRSLKREVKAPADLGERVDDLLLKRLQQSLAIANKAGAVILGYAKLDTELERGTIALLLHGSDAAAGGQDKLDRKFRAVAEASGRAAPVVALLTTPQMSLAMGRENVVHAGLKQGGATDRVLDDAERLRRYRSGIGASM
jgi:predicted RNA-binding protein YlxR (DUF448 family)